MIKKKKIFSILVIMMLCILAGCGGQDDPGGNRVGIPENLGQESKPEETGAENPEQKDKSKEADTENPEQEDISQEAGTDVLKQPAKVNIKKVSFEDNYLEEVQMIDLTGRISYEDFDKLLGVWEDELYYISYKERGLIIYKVNYLEESIEPEIIYSLDEGNLWYYHSMRKDKIYLLVLEDGKGFSFRIDEISLDGQVQEIYPSTYSIAGPIVYDLPEYLIVNYWTGEYFIMEAISFDDHWVKQIDKRELVLDEKGKMSGDYILYGGGIEPDGFYYEVVSLEHEYLDSDGNTAIYYYDFGLGIADMVIDPPDKSQFLSGGRDYIVRCVYAYDAPLRVSGEFYQRQEDGLGRCSLTELYTTNDLHWLKELWDGCAIGYTERGEIFILDVNRMQRSVYLIPEPEEGMRSTNAVLMDEKVYYGLYDKEKGNVFLYIMVLK